MKSTELFNLQEHVDSRDSFLAFVKALELDFEDMRLKELANPSKSEPAANGWFTASIGEFLEAMHAWAKDTDPSTEPSWRLFAEFLHNGKLYE